MLASLAVLFGCATKVLANEAVVYDGYGVRLAWTSKDFSVSEWTVAAGGVAREAQWRDLVTRGPGGAISRHLQLNGVETEGATWRLHEAKDGLLREARSADGRLAVHQRLRATDGEYRFRLEIELENLTDSPLTFADGVRLQIGPGLGEYPVEGFGIADALYSYVEPVVSLGGSVERIELEDSGEAAAKTAEDSRFDWFGLHTRYFALLLAPEGEQVPTRLRLQEGSAEAVAQLASRYLPEVEVDLGIQELEAHARARREFLVFSGPKSSSALSAGEEGFDELQFGGLWSWMRGLSLALLWMLEKIQALVQSWGAAIVLLAVLVRLAMYPVAKRVLKSQRTFAEVQRRIQPDLQEIKRRFRGGEQSEQILALYERHGVSPLAGLKPLLIVLIQIPVFVALFHVLGQAYELRDASFLWIETLAEPDRLFAFGATLPFFGSHFNLLPVLMAVTTLLTIKASPAPASDDSQGVQRNAFLILMAIGFFVLFYPFPSGMVLYWTVANVLHLLQQAFVERQQAS